VTTARVLEGAHLETADHELDCLGHGRRVDAERCRLGAVGHHAHLGQADAQALVQPGEPAAGFEALHQLAGVGVELFHRARTAQLDLERPRRGV
jgi:hypothetical protein